MPSEPMPWEPRWPRVTALVVCVLAALTLLWPLFTGQILFGGARSDMFIAGYAFRLFGAEQFKATGAIPQWNPYLFGGLPYIAAMHGDIFYPTAWLRWIMPVDLAITWGMAVHFVLAGWLMFGLARALRLGWTAAITAGVAYELSGIVASQMSPGHDGKLFVSALTPLAFWVLLRAIRGGQTWAFGAFSVVVSLLVLGHYQMCYFLMLALGLWALYLSFWDAERRSDLRPWRMLGFAAIAVVVGIGIAGIQVVPFLEYIRYSPRAAGGPSTGWDWVNSFAMPPSEIVTAILPQFNGVLDHYWGTNPLKFHTEYLGVLPLLLAIFAWGDTSRRRLVMALAGGALLFQLFAFAGHTPFYRPFFEFLPMLKKMRAVGMVFFLVAFPVSLLAGIGVERILAGQVRPVRILYVAGALGLFALLGVAGILQVFAEGIAIAERMAAVQANAAELRLGALRLLLFVVIGGGVAWGVAAGRLRGAGAAALLVVALAADLWSIDRLFYQFSPRASELFRSDEVIQHLQATAPPYRVFDLGAYPGATLMAYRVPVALGYHGNELRFYDELTGKDQGYNNLRSPSLLDLLALRFIILSDTATIPGWHRVAGPSNTAFGAPATLFERDTAPAYARVLVNAAKLRDDQVVETIVNPRFPVRQVVLFSDTASVQPAGLQQPLPISAVTATVPDWKPGAMRIALQGQNSGPSYLVVSENWYPDWRAVVDGKPAQVLRADHSLIGVVIPPGAKEVALRFESQAYERGKLVSLISLLVAAVLVAAPLVLSRRVASA